MCNHAITTVPVKYILIVLGALTIDAMELKHQAIGTSDLAPHWLYGLISYATVTFIVTNIRNEIAYWKKLASYLKVNIV